jgi:hypothetical protein
VVYIETLLWYKRIGIGKEGFDDDLNELKAEKKFFKKKRSKLDT